MKRLIVFILLIWSIPAFGFLGFGSDKKKDPVVKPKDCHYSIHIKGGESEPKIFYIFSGPCGEIKQVGIVDETTRHVFELVGNGIVSKTEYYGETKKGALIKTYWGDLKAIKFYEN